VLSAGICKFEMCSLIRSNPESDSKDQVKILRCFLGRY